MASNKARAKGPQKAVTTQTMRNRAYWSREIELALKRWDRFYKDGDAVVDRFLLESSGDVNNKYNILYSSTETMRPSLYGQTPKVMAKGRDTDGNNPMRATATMMMERIGQYAMERTEFDAVLENVVSDFCLPGIGVAWVRYAPKFENRQTGGGTEAYLVAEGIGLDYVYFKDFLSGHARVWKEVPWVARRCYFTKKAATLRFGEEKAGLLTYSFNRRDKDDRNSNREEECVEQAIVWEIWDKESGKAYWYSEECPALLDEKTDPLKLENFFPCPEPVRAVWSTKRFIPKSLYSQYKAQAATLDILTQKIRNLTTALKVRGLYDGSQASLQRLLDGEGNQMIAIDNWPAIMGQGGINGSVQWLPLKEIVTTLGELYKQREIAKGEIYEITGFSDIVRGVSKASETLGAQQIKADWATGRLKSMQRQVQRFCRDLIRIMVEIACEHFSDQTLIEFSGAEIPEETPEERMAAAQAMQQGVQPPPTQAQQAQQAFAQVSRFVRDQKLRAAQVGIETDSTILPDEQKERKDRMEFLGQIGAFLQQAGPMALQYPDMRGLLGAIMMFTIRTFSASRPLEKEFESFVLKLQQQPAMSADGKQEGQGDNGEGAKEAAQITAQAQQAKAQMDDATKRYQIDTQAATEREKAQRDHEFRLAQLQLDRERLELERAKLRLETVKGASEMMHSDREYEDGRNDKADETARSEQERADAADNADLDREAGRQDADRQFELEEKKIDAGKAAKPVDGKKK